MLVKWYDLVFFLVLLVILSLLATRLLDEDLATEDALSLLIGLAALASSWLGLYLAALRPFFTRPRLKYSCSVQRSDPKEAESQQGWKPSWFLRLRVANKGETPARNCVGRLLELRAGGRRIESFDSLNLYWMRQSKPEAFQPVDIQGQGDFFWLDVAQIKKSENTLSMRVMIPCGDRLVLDPDFPDAPDLPPGEYFARIGVYAEGTYIRPVWFRIEWNGEYSADPPCRFEKLKMPK